MAPCSVQLDGEETLTRRQVLGHVDTCSTRGLSEQSHHSSKMKRNSSGGIPKKRGAKVLIEDTSLTS